MLPAWAADTGAKFAVADDGGVTFGGPDGTGPRCGGGNVALFTSGGAVPFGPAFPATPGAVDGLAPGFARAGFLRPSES